MSDDSDRLSFEVPTTVEDYAAFLVYVTRRPRRLALHAGLFLLFGLALLLLQLAIGLLGTLAGTRGPMTSAIQAYLSHGFLDDLAPVAPWGAAGLALLFCLNVVVFTPRRSRAIATRIVAAYPGRSIENGKPTLVNRLILDDRGIESVVTDERVFIAWPLVRELVETKAHIFLMTSRDHAAVIPKSDVDATTIKELVDRVERRLGGGS